MMARSHRQAAPRHSISSTSSRSTSTGFRNERSFDFEVEKHALVFGRELRKDRVSGWRWLLGAWGIGTYRQDDTIDVRYEVDGEPRSRARASDRQPDDDPTLA